jgi:acetyl-CoA carboxylase carboxyl transferase subunit beta
MDRLPDAASVALIDHDKVLLIQRNRAPYHGLWTLPGGRLEPGETPEEAAVREIREELGLTCYRLMPVCRMWLGPDRRFLLQVFATEAFEGVVVPSAEIADYRWVTADGFGTLRTTSDLGGVIEGAFRLFDRR